MTRSPKTFDLMAQYRLCHQLIFSEMFNLSLNKKIHITLLKLWDTTARHLYKIGDILSHILILFCNEPLYYLNA